MSDILLTLLCPPSLEEKLIDHLLVASGTLVFTSTTTAAHGLSTSELNPVEQVMGRARAVQLQLIMDKQECMGLLDTIHELFPKTGLRFWTSDIIVSGELA
ncbi:DUF3240 family protein [Pseudomonas aeruginosa]|uniref:DUF3240 family protein n=1 Tax=Pseudomonas aeruginosa TaxID=287 RepID=UPI0009367D9A|nr:DUF3240 family protein [Pseudomonas aeruginosa]EKJ8514518.1 DUF3240 domain-containing protein [Pseudomonas aeruginosa]ELK7308613.1 DUF3240 family protein [Pseudomonas aeruginosa]ELP0276332.1 DUF3240 family protein [Pseudomonas aeruginosa]MBG4805735.1 DUF3240 family protein [Pseudomonas aeruginosa]MBG5029260.1 DUF3240 family protein [Pseudomonas aeruginosa]